MNTTWRLVNKGYGVPFFFIEAINKAPPPLTLATCEHKDSSLRIDGPLYVQGLNIIGCHNAQNLHWNLGHPCTYKGDDGTVDGPLYVQGSDAIGCRKNLASERAPGRRRSKRPMASRRTNSPHTYPALAGFGVYGAFVFGDLR